MAEQPVGAVEALAPVTPAERRDAIRQRLSDFGARAFLVTSRANVRYLAGFTGSVGVLVIRREDPDLLLTSSLYAIQTGEEVDPLVETRICTDPPLVAARAALIDADGTIAFESAHLSVADWQAWRDADGSRLEGVTGWVESLRAVKSPEERSALARAAAVVDSVFEDILSEIRPGATEHELAARLEWLLAQHGSQRPAFETIVLCGERAALPHGRPGGRVVARHEVVLFDFGAVVDGYASDLSRTVAYGDPGQKVREIYHVVLGAQRAAIEGIRSELTGRDADALARGPIEASGLGDYFRHSLGHGIGLEVHEDPRLSRTSDARLRAGMVVTVEPGIYIQELGGVRIEDVVVVGSEGVEVLTHAPKDDLIVL